jgi:hypothetical protein
MLFITGLGKDDSRKKSISKKSRDTVPLNAYPDTVRPIELRGPISNDDEVVVSSNKTKFKTGILASMNCSSIIGKDAP